jgi:pimeloyl-ACP methyl ester carboxylesterase
MTASPLLAEPEAITLEAPGPDGPLRGTLLSTGNADDPVALIIPGSGPTDRDGNNPLGMRAAPYRLLAEGLAAARISSLRIDKRGMFGSAGAIPDPNAVTIRDYAGDVHRWIDVLKQRTGTRCIWLIGHSEGGLIALATAQEGADLCGLILIASPGRPLGEILREQLRANPANAPILAQADAAIDRLEAGERVDTATLHPALAQLFAPAVQGFLIDAFARDAAALAAKVAQPVLIVQGDRDLQVSTRDAERLKSAKPNAVLEIIPNANHVLKTVASDDPAANIATYSNPDLPLAEGVATTIAQFIRSNR